VPSLDSPGVEACGQPGDGERLLVVECPLALADHRSDEAVILERVELRVSDPGRLEELGARPFARRPRVVGRDRTKHLVLVVPGVDHIFERQTRGVVVERGSVGRGRVIRRRAVWTEGIEPIPDDPQREEVIALLREDPTQALEIILGELPVPRRCPFRIDEPLALEKPDLGDRHVGESVAEMLEDLTDRQVGAGRFGCLDRHWADPAARPVAPPRTNVSTNRPT